MKDFLKQFCVVIVIAAFTAAFYAHTLNFGFAWDDTRLIIKSPYIKNPAYIPAYFITDMWRLSSDPMQSTYYRPLYLLSFFMDYARGGLDPKTYHFTDLIIMIFLALALYTFIKKISGSIKISFLATIFFVVHPVTAQAASWISTRSELSFLAFMLVAFTFYIKASGAAHLYSRVSLYLISVSMFIFGILNKETALFLIPLIIWYDYLLRYEARPRKLLNNLKDYAPYLAVVLLYSWIKCMISEGAPCIHIKNTWTSQPLTLALLTCKTIPYYVNAVLFPSANDIQALKIVSVPSPGLAGISVVILAGFFVFYFFKCRLSYKKEIFFLGWIAITSSYILLLATLMGSRFLLLPLVGVTGFISIFAARLADNASAVRRIVIYSICCVLIMAYAVLSYSITFCWKDDGSLLKLMVAKYPNDPDVRENLGYYYLSIKDLKSSIVEYKKALELNPKLNRARFDLAHIYYTLGRSDEALAEFKTLAGQHNLMPHVHQALAVLYDEKKDYRKAIEEVKFELSLKASDRLKMLEFLTYLYGKNGEEKNAERLWNAVKRCYAKKSSLP